MEVDRTDLSEVDASEFILSEVLSRRADIQARISRVETDMQYGLLSSGGLWAWFFSHPTLPGLEIAYWLPLLLSGMFLIKWFVQDIRIKSIAKYILHIEGSLNLPKSFGWETNRAQYAGPMLAKFTSIFWFAMIVGNGVGGAYFSQLSLCEVDSKSCVHYQPNKSSKKDAVNCA